MILLVDWLQLDFLATDMYIYVYLLQTNLYTVLYFYVRNTWKERCRSGWKFLKCTIKILFMTAKRMWLCNRHMFLRYSFNLDSCKNRQKMFQEFQGIRIFQLKKVNSKCFKILLNKCDAFFFPQQCTSKFEYVVRISQYFYHFFLLFWKNTF